MLIHFLFSPKIIEHLIAVLWANTMWISNAGVHALFYLNNTVWALIRFFIFLVLQWAWFLPGYSGVSVALQRKTVGETSVEKPHKFTV